MVPTSVTFHTEPKFLVSWSIKRSGLLAELRSPVLLFQGQADLDGVDLQRFPQHCPLPQGDQLLPTVCPSWLPLVPLS